jgi:HEAT repeat protein
MTSLEDFFNERLSKYLRSLCGSDTPWWKTYAFMNEIDDATWFEFELDSKTQDKRKQPEEKSTEKTLPVLQAVEDYAHEKILIVGSPGAGKSTLLTRLLWQAAHKAQQNSRAPIPVLVELKLYGAGIWELIQTSLENCDLYLEVSDIKKLVEHQRLLLLADGFNELPSDRARTEFKRFCTRKISVIVTLRDGTTDLELERKLQIQPLTDLKVRKFLQSRLPGRVQARIKELSDRVKDFGQTPLMVWMLFSIFRQNGDIPTTRGEAYRAFTTLYVERAKEGIDLDESRGLLGKLAFELMHAEKPTDFRLDISEVDAQNLVGSEKALKHLVRNHLLQAKGKPGNCRISFCHQSLQEYYAAEALLVMLRDEHPDVMKDDRLQYFYLNYLKWTEPISIALSLMEDETQIIRLVRLAVEMDWVLGAQLAGELNMVFHEKTIKLIKTLRLPKNIKIKLLGITCSNEIVNLLRKKLADKNVVIRWLTVEALGNVKSEAALTLLIEALKDPNYRIRCKTVDELSKANSETVVTALTKVFKDDNFPDDELSNIRWWVVRALGEIGSESAVTTLFDALEDSYPSQIRSKALSELRKLGVEISIDKILQLLEDSDPVVCFNTAHQVSKMKNLFEIETEIQARGMDDVIERILIFKHYEDYGSLVSDTVASLVIGFHGTDRTPLIDGLNNEDWEVCCQCAAALGELRDESAVPALEEILYDKDRSVVWSDVTAALAKIGTQSAVFALINCIESEDGELRKLAIEALGGTRNRKLDELLALVIQHDEDRDVRLSTAIALGKIGGKIAEIALTRRALIDEDLLVAATSAQELGKISGCANISSIWVLECFSQNTLFFETIKIIQARYQFYNHEIAQWKLAPHTTQRSPIDLLDKIDKTTQDTNQRTKQMANQPKNDFSGATFQAPVNFGDNPTGNFIGTQNNYAADPEVQSAIADIQIMISQLQAQYPQVTTETQALAILDVEFTEIKQNQTHKLATLRKQILNPERHLQAIKAALGEVAKHYLEESVWAKTTITYLDKLSEEPNHGA